MKKNILFVIDSLNIGGAERSLISLLSLLDYSKYEVDLQLFYYGGAFEQYLPEEVTLLPPLNYTKFLNRSILSQFCTLEIQNIIARWRYSFSIRKKNLQNSDRAYLWWKYSSGCVKPTEKHYDVAIAYAQGVPTMYVADRVNADRKLGWVNGNYLLMEKTRLAEKQFYEKLDQIVAVSDFVNQYMQSLYPEFGAKMKTVRDIMSPKLIYGMAEYPMSHPLKNEKPNLITVSRLNGTQKGLDITVEAASILHQRNISFRWYVLGEGPFRMNLEKYIQEHDLEDTFIILGSVPNPYPYLKQATLYVQTSRYEGYGLSIAEARLLNIPVVTTAYEGVEMQMVPDKNGVVVPIDATSVADAIQKLLENQALREEISTYQKQEKKGNVEEIEKVYQLIS